MKNLTLTACLMLFFLIPVSAQISVPRELMPPITADLAFYPQGMQYKLRLDSLQKTVPLPYNEYVQKYIDIYASRKSQIAKVIGLSGYYFPIFEKSLKEYQVPDEIKYVSIVESSLDPHAVSRTGATGPWQFMPNTAKAYHLSMNRNIDERKDPVTASHAAAAYFRDAYNELGDWLLAIAAYNCGQGAVTRAIKRSGGKADFWQIRRFLPLETQNYVPAFIATTYIMNCYSKHDIAPSAPEFPLLTDVIEVSSRVSLNLIAKAANVDLKQLLILNPSFKKNMVLGTPASPQHLVIPGISDGSTFAALYKVINSEQQPARVSIASYSPGRPAPKYIAYRVRPGDTLSEISEKFNSSVAGIKSRNHLRSSVLQPGMLLRIGKG